MNKQHQRLDCKEEMLITEDELNELVEQCKTKVNEAYILVQRPMTEINALGVSMLQIHGLKQWALTELSKGGSEEQTAPDISI